MTKRVAVAVTCALILGVGGVQPAGAALRRVGQTFSIYRAAMLGTSIAYGNGVYLVVSAPSNLAPVLGQFTAADGTPLGPTVVISESTTSYTFYPRVAFSPHANGGQGAFLVTWHQSAPGVASHVRARLVASPGVLVGPDTLLASDGSRWTSGAAVAYSTVSREFLVVWAGRYPQSNDISAARVSNTGALLAIVSIASSPTYENNPAVAYNPVTDEFLVTYAGYTSFAFVNAQRVKAGTGQLLGAAITLVQTVGTYVTDVTYNPATNQFLASWYQGHVSGRVIAANGTLVGSIVPLSVRYSANDALSVDYNASLASFLLVSQDSATVEVGGVEIAGNGQPLGSGMQLTASGGSGNFYPRVAANAPQSEWMLVASRGFAQAIGQRVGGGSNTIAPPPPPPSCTVQPGTTTVSLTGAAQSQNITVTASTAGCPWTASSSASWISITAGSSGTGPGAVTYSVTRNATGASRTGTISVTGGTVTIQQSASTGNAAVHDMTGDGSSDLMWHNTATGRVALWSLRGHVVTSTYFLTGAAVDTNWKAMGTGDLNGDGYADIVWRHVGGAVACWSLRDGQVAATEFLVGGTPASVATEPDPMWEIRAVGDVDGDGRADIIWQNMGVGTLRVWFMDGTNVRSSVNVNVGMPNFTWKIAGAADLNADGKADIIWQNHSTGDLGAWLLDGATVLGQSHLSIARIPDLNWKVRGVGDTNGDGYADIIWQNIGTGGLAVWYMYGVSVIESQWLSIGAVPDANWTVVGPG